MADTTPAASSTLGFSSFLLPECLVGLGWQWSQIKKLHFPGRRSDQVTILSSEMQLEGTGWPSGVGN